MSIAKAITAIELVAPASSYIVARIRLALDTSVKSFIPIRGKAEVPRGVLPRSASKEANEKVLVFVEEGPAAEEAKKAGAEVLGNKDIAKITSGEIELSSFTRALATPSMYPLITPLGRVLGPLGLMPNPKKGGVTNALVAAIEGARAASSVAFEMKETDKDGGVVEVEVAKVGWLVDDVRENVGAVAKAVLEANENKRKHMIIHSLHLTSRDHPIRIPVRLKEIGKHLAAAKLQKGQKK
ncbi:hypothetical protein HDU93_000174 [Gonapodya sp. JEL0774]|nr:hypothetical protein HDU93_000174 [Gonapodya sp. JEL0774]